MLLYLLLTTTNGFMVVGRCATNGSRVRHKKKEDDETHETDDGTRQDERHAPITFHIMTGNQRTQNVTHRRMRIPNSKNQT